MTTLIIVILIIVLLGGALGYHQGWVGGPGIGGLGLVLVVLLILWLAGVFPR